MSGLKKGAPQFSDTHIWYFFDSTPVNNAFERTLRRRLRILPRLLLRGAYGLNRTFSGSQAYNAHWPSLAGHDDLSDLTEATAWFEFTTCEQDAASKILEGIGVAPDEKYVCLFPRDPEYGNAVAGWKVESGQRYRNCDLMTFQLGIDYLIEKGYTVIRMGRRGTRNNGNKLKGVIDYGASRFVSDFADLAITSRCTFAISCDTGASHLAILFRKPILITNVMTPWGLKRGTAVSYYLMKTWKNPEGRRLSLGELLFLGTDFGPSGPGPDHFDSLDVICLDNSSLEILAAIKAMVRQVEFEEPPTEALLAARQRSAYLLSLRTPGNWNVLFPESFLKDNPAFL